MTDYRALSGDEKLQVLWDRVRADPYEEGEAPTAAPGLWARRKLFGVDFNLTSFTHVDDELPADRVKLIHRWGTCAKVTLVIDEPHGNTGVFETGAAGLMRFSDATGGKTFVPSLAIKFPLGGRPSLNLFALPAVERSPKDRDCLSHPLANSTPAAMSLDGKLIGSVFERTAAKLGGTRLYPNYLPLHPLAEVRADGSGVEAPVVPDRIELHPTAEARAARADHDDFRVQLGGLEPGLRLFDVKLAAAIDEEAQPAGWVRLDSPFVASAYGDDRLFFQHHVGPVAEGS